MNVQWLMNAICLIAMANEWMLCLNAMANECYV